SVAAPAPDSCPALSAWATAAGFSTATAAATTEICCLCQFTAGVSIFLKDFPRHADCRYCIRPAGVEREVRDRPHQLVLRNPVPPRQAEVGAELLGAVHRDERAHGHQTPVARRQRRIRPNLAVEDVVRELG